LLLITALGLLAAFWGCDQTDDVTAPRSVTRVWLSAERLPTPPIGMVYELWASRTDVTALTADDVKSLGRFSYVNHDTLEAFLDPTSGMIRADSNQFDLDDDLFGYQYLFVSVERVSDINDVPGPIMLMQQVTGATDTLRMYFPLSDEDNLGRAIVRLNMETSSDGNRRNRDGYGLWFSSYEVILWSISDTTHTYASLRWDTVGPDIVDGDTINKALLTDRWPDSVWFVIDTVYVDFGRDTLVVETDQLLNGAPYVPVSTLWLQHIGAKQNVIYKTDADSAWPAIFKVFDSSDIQTISRNVILDVYTQDDFALPNYSAYGWKYQGWIVSNAPGFDSARIGEFTAPAWDFRSGTNFIPGYEGGLLTTGTFTHIDSADDANPFTYSVDWVVDSGAFLDTVEKRPNLPGEDFLDTDSLSAAFGLNFTDGINLVPALPGTGATAFITMEPVNRVTDTTNSPLIIFTRELPNFYSTGDLGAGYSRTMIPWTGSAAGTNGLPKVVARIVRL